MDKTWRLVNFCEIDKFAINSYCAVHNVDESLNLGDIVQVDETKLEDFTMMCGGSPCQDFSVAGAMKGALWTCDACGYEYNPLKAHWDVRDKCPKCSSIHIEKTRSSLLAEYLRVLRAKHPKFAMYENVKNIVGSQFKETFDMFVKELDEYGYNVYWKVLNAMDYGVPQNRERVYIVIIDKEIDNGKFQFPTGFELLYKLKDVLDDIVEEKYYLTDTQIANIANWKAYQRPLQRVCGTDSVCPTLTARGAGAYHSGMILYSNKVKGNTNRDDESKQIKQKYETKQGYRLYLQPEKISESGIRKLTPLECWRLMGFSDKDFNVAKSAGMSNTQLYKQAGNSIVTDVLYYIYLELYRAMPYLFDDLAVTSLFSGIGAFEIALNRLFDTINKELTDKN